MRQLNLFENSDQPEFSSGIRKGLNVVSNGEILLYPDFFSPEESDAYFNIFRETILWKQESMTMYGKKINIPRLMAWYGNSDKRYTFSGISLQSHIWTKELLEIKAKIEPQAGIEFNSVLLNFYRNGKDSISWHADDEVELGKNPTIASVNFGAARKFQLKHLPTKEKLEVELTHGSLLIMQGELQHFWHHQVPKTSKPVGERINLTFRVIHERI